MFGLSLASIKWIAAGMAALFILAAVGGFWLSYRHLQDAYATAQANAATAKASAAISESSLDVERKKNADLNDRITKAEETNREITAAYQANMDELRTVKAKLAKHDLQRLSNAHPKMVERALNASSITAWNRLQSAGHPPPDGDRGPAAAADHPPATGPAARPASAAR